MSKGLSSTVKGSTRASTLSRWDTHLALIEEEKERGEEGEERGEEGDGGEEVDVGHPGKCKANFSQINYFFNLQINYF